MDDYAQAASDTAGRIGAAASDEAESLKEQITKLSNQIKEYASAESIDSAVHESPYLVAAVALVVGVVIGSVITRSEPKRRYW